MAKAPKLSQRDVDRLRAFYARLGSGNPDEARAVLRHILLTLKQLGLTWAKLLKAVTVSTPPDKRFKLLDLVHLRQLHELLGSADDETRETIVTRMNDILERYRKRWIDVLDLIAAVAAPEAANQADLLAAPAPALSPNPLDLLTVIVPDALEVTEDEAIVICCWVVGSYIYKQFAHFPRLALLSPVRRCGKSTTLKLLVALCANPHKTDNITPAAIFHLIDSRSSTLLIDEADNLGLVTDRTLRAVLNSGHEAGGKFDRVARQQGGGVYSYSTFCPVAVGAIGLLPMPLMDRSWVVHMTRTKRNLPLQMHRRSDQDKLEFVRNQIVDWVQGRAFNTDPQLPWEFTSRRADNARALVAVADACSPEWGQVVRDALVRLSHRYRDEDLVVMLLDDIRKVFNFKGVDRIRSTELVDALVEMADQPWREFQGIRDNQQPRKLTPTSMAHMLKVFFPPIGPIKSRTIRFREGTDAGFYRSQFEPAWAAFLDEPVTRSQSNAIKRLLLPT